MPTQNHPVEPSAFRELQRRVERLENENHRSSGRKLLTVDRFTTASLPGPTEGQVAIEATSDDLKYYANSAWRTVGGTTEYGYDTAYNLLMPHILNNGSIYNGFSFTDNLGTNRYNQFYIEATTDTKNWGRIVRLGPAGSLWGFTLVMRNSSDAAKIKVQIGWLDEDGTGAGTHPGTGTLTDGEDGSVTYYDLYRIPSTSTLEADLYTAGTTEYQFYGLQWQFQLNGTGAPTGAPTLDTSDSLNLLTSGAGMYGIKFLTADKNASSSSYRARYHYAVLHRMTENLLET